MTLNGTGIAVYTTSSLGVGAHSITAAYGGDGGQWCIHLDARRV